MNAIIPVPVRGKKEFTNEERNGILQFLLQRTIGGKLQRGSIGVAAVEFRCHPVTISRIWKRARESYSKGNRCANVDALKKQCGRKRKNHAANLERMRDISLNRRSTLLSLSYAIDVPKTTLFRMFKRGEFKRESSHIKPLLTDENKRERVRFALSKVLPSGFFQDLYNYVHIDEKWFFLTKAKKSYYLCLDEEAPYRSCKSKRFITKVHKFFYSEQIT